MVVCVQVLYAVSCYNGSQFEVVNGDITGGVVSGEET
jgi:hypothetical protein